MHPPRYSLWPPSWPVALLLSLSLHALLLLLSLLPALVPVPRSPITVEILHNARTVAPLSALPEKKPPPAEEPRPPGRESKAAGAGGVRKKPAAKAHGPRPGEAPPVQSLEALAEGDASVLVLLRMAPLRKSPHRQAAEELLSAFPDAAILAAGTAFGSPEKLVSFLFDNLQALALTTADVRSLTATLLLAVHRPGLDVQSRLAGRPALSFDPRRLVLLAPGVTAYGPTEVLGAWGTQPAASPAGAGPAWLAELRALSAAPGGALVAEVRNLHRLLRLQKGVPTPMQLSLAVSAEQRPAVRLRLVMQSEADAEQILGLWPKWQEKLRGQLFWLGLSRLLSDLHAERRGTQAELVGHLPGDDADALLRFLKMLLPPPPAEVARPQEPPDLGPAETPDQL